MVFLGESEDVMKKKIIVVVLMSVMAVFATACGETTSETGYKTEVTWADTGNYMFAVEVPDFSGDIFEAGTYRFYPDAVDIEDASKTPVVWDIYISQNEYSDSSQIQESEYVATVGGLEKDEYTCDLSVGQYVYINYNDALGDPTGMLQIEKV